MKLCPSCKAELDDNTCFCLLCMTSLEEKEQINPPARRARRWPMILVSCLLLGALAALIIFLIQPDPPLDSLPLPSETQVPTTAPVEGSDAPVTYTQTVGGVRYTLRPATREDHPSAIFLDSYYVLIHVEGSPDNGVYQVPSFLGDDMSRLVTAVADGAFAGTKAKSIDLGYNVRYVWGNAFGGAPLTDLYLHSDVFIEQAAFSGCTESLTIHCPSYLENTEGALWADLAQNYGFNWQDEAI